MTRVLIVTVGGSPDPILKAVELHQPDEVIFACSAPPCERPSLDQVVGEGTPCRHLVDGQPELRPNLVSQLGLKGFRDDLQLIHLPEPDDLSDCLHRLQGFVQGLHQRFSRLELFGDFTGGTKSMSAALAFALLDQKATVSVVSGRRDNLVRIEKSDGLRILDPLPIITRRLLSDRLPPLLEAHFYERARSMLIDLQRDHSTRFLPTQHEALQGLIAQLEVLSLWDKFSWRVALDRAEAIHFANEWPDLWQWWIRVEAAMHWVDPETDPGLAITGYELVQDLLLNAERRGRRGWFDDAVARLYRASELLAQTYITLELRVDGIADWTASSIKLQSGVQINCGGVLALYRSLRTFEAPTGLGGIYARQSHELRQLFNARNASLLGHGLQPITEDRWQALQARIANLLTTTLQELHIQQGASPCQLPGTRWLQQPLVTALFNPL